MIENDASGLNNDGRQSRRPLITISIPVLDEADNIDSLYQRLCRLGETMAERCDLEFVFSDNHSQDLTWAKLSQLASTDPRVRAIRFSKNVGFQRSILANFLHSRGDAVLQIDADLQDPPELLSEFFELWRSGYRVVYGIRKMRPEGPLLRWFRRFGYWFIDKVSEHPIPRDVGDFRLIDRTVVNALIKMNSPSPYLRGMIASLGFSQTGIPYNRDARVHGKSKFNVARITQLGVTAVVNHSVVPLRIASIVGVVTLGISFIGGLYFVIGKLIQPDYPRGLASVHVLVLFGIGLQSFLLGIIGEYLLRIYLILRAEPLAMVEQTLNFPAEEIRL